MEIMIRKEEVYTHRSLVMGDMLCWAAWVESRLVKRLKEKEEND